MTTIILWAAALLFLTAFFFLGGRELIGELICMAFPRHYLQKDDVMYIYLNGKYNRKATITGVGSNHVEVYDVLPLPLSYRGRYYAYGADSTGTRFTYVKSRRYYKWVRIAMILCTLFAIIDDECNLVPTQKEEQESTETTEEESHED